MESNITQIGAHQKYLYFKFYQNFHNVFQWLLIYRKNPALLYFTFQPSVCHSIFLFSLKHSTGFLNTFYDHFTTFQILNNLRASTMRTIVMDLDIHFSWQDHQALQKLSINSQNVSILFWSLFFVFINMPYYFDISFLSKKSTSNKYFQIPLSNRVCKMLTHLRWTGYLK